MTALRTPVTVHKLIFGCTPRKQDITCTTLNTAHKCTQSSSTNMFSIHDNLICPQIVVNNYRKNAILSGQLKIGLVFVLVHVYHQQINACTSSLDSGFA